MKKKRGRGAPEEELVAADGWWEGGAVFFTDATPGGSSMFPFMALCPWWVIHVPVDGLVPMCKWTPVTKLWIIFLGKT